MKPVTNEEFLAAYDKYAEAIYRHCFFRIYSKERAEELTQETFMKAWQYLADGNRVDNLKSFLYRVATNLIIDDSRKHKMESLDVLMEESASAEPSYQGHREIESGIILKDALAALRDLPSDYGQLLTLRYVDDLDIQEIAELLKITPNNVSVKLNRAVASLRKKMPDVQP